MEVLGGVMGLIAFGAIILLVLASIFLPFFVVGIYNSNKELVRLNTNLESIAQTNLKAQNEIIKILWETQQENNSRKAPVPPSLRENNSAQPPPQPTSRL